MQSKDLVLSQQLAPQWQGQTYLISAPSSHGRINSIQDAPELKLVDPLGNPSGSFAAASAPVSALVSPSTIGSSVATTGSATGTTGTTGESVGTTNSSSTIVTDTRCLCVDAIGLRRWGASSESSRSSLPRPLPITLPKARPKPLVLTMIYKCLPQIPSLLSLTQSHASSKDGHVDQLDPHEASKNPTNCGSPTTYADHLHPYPITTADQV
ncbi:hypothetical protein GmHk_03G007639 [Glycine max]|nr:hypothetical protein GmHk_03G007639 [Glycine max]